MWHPVRTLGTYSPFQPSYIVFGATYADDPAPKGLIAPLPAPIERQNA